VSDDALLEGLTVLGGILVAVTTGLEIRIVDQSFGRTRMALYFPELSIGATLLSGLALAELAIIVVLGRWPVFARFLLGPIAAIYGLAWFQSALIESRLDWEADAEEAQMRLHDRRVTRGLSPPLIQIGFSAQMGVLLCAIGARRLLEFAVGAILALCAATAGITARLEQMLRPLNARTALHCLSGALLFALGVGTIIRQATQDGTSQGFATLLVTGVLWVVGLTVLLRLSRPRRVPPR
jgi:hypothetical protein